MKEEIGLLHYEIENVRLLLIQKVKETKGFNHSLVLEYSMILDTLINKAQRNTSQS
ncbi:aspartyl-phosphate phosphatase Spo0E family protein [Bacillus pinisoli]|uniref:aspartyl-phosphate phosphatase Spo0E family protein n=1 Tax=Bacillus pinisoli TaxID=2901866 RepID=UPI001FF2456E|nr:aspartyl-phosphate phosphatase Spo0E family protein [Bacillus pinisoli]